MTSAHHRARTALAEWTIVAVLLLGCAATTAGVMMLAAHHTLAFVLIGIGAGVVVMSAIAWTVLVKTQQPSPRLAKEEL